LRFRPEPSRDFKLAITDEGCPGPTPNGCISFIMIPADGKGTLPPFRGSFESLPPSQSDGI